MNKTFRYLTLVPAIAAIAACSKKKGEPLSVYPNPAATYIVFDATGNAKYRNGEIRIKDFLGNVLRVVSTEDSGRAVLQIDTFRRGVYHYSYTADKMKEQTGKIVFN